MASPYDGYVGSGRPDHHRHRRCRPVPGLAHLHRLRSGGRNGPRLHGSPREQPAQAIGLLLAFLLLWVVSSAFLAWVFIAQTGARDGALKGRNATIENARRDVAVAEQELSRITTSRLTDVIRQDIERVVSDTRSNGCDRLDGQFSREQCPRVFE